MRKFPLALAVAGLALIVLAVVVRIPNGILFSPRSVLEFAQVILLASVALGVAALGGK